MSSAFDRLKSFMAKTPTVAKKSLGQNFLISDHVIGKIIKEVMILKPEFLIEIGPGPGALTDLLRPITPNFQVIELDRDFAAYWQAEGLNVIEADALKWNWSLVDLAKTALVSNLPYQISSSLVIDRSLDSSLLTMMVLMFQKEVAQRIRALPKTENYGLLSVIAQAFWEVETVTDAGPRDFDPPPKVASRVLKFTPRKKEIQNSKVFLEFVKAAFSQRRKLMKNNLKPFLGKYKVESDILENWLGAHEISSQARAEELSVSHFIQLFHHLGFQ